MIEFFTLISVLLTYIWVRLLHLASTAERPKVFYKNPCTPFIQSLLKACPILNTIYWPTYLWGRSGHFQSIVHAKLGRTNPKWPESQRFHISMPDGATMSYDLFAPHEEKSKEKGKFTLALCPGIANSSESVYISTFASYAQSHGFKVAVLNHLGALKSEKLTSPRIFTYGNTEELDSMINHLMELYPDSKILLVGFSMGANIVAKYLGESVSHQQKVLCGMSICQGYEIIQAKNHFLEWAHLRRVYVYVVTRVQRRLLSRHRSLLFCDEVKQKCGSRLNEQKVFSAMSLLDIDENYSCYRAGFKNVEEYYTWSSSAYYLHNIKIPMLYMNAEDDPLCPAPLFKYPREGTEKCENTVFITTKHGGHLGYFEGGLMIPNEVTWLDRVIIEYADAITSMYRHGHLPNQTSTTCSEDSESAMNAVETKNGKSGKEEIETEKGLVEAYMDTISGTLDSGVEVQKSRVVTSDNEKSDEKEKRGSLKRGSIVKQATSYVQ